MIDVPGGAAERQRANLELFGKMVEIQAGAADKDLDALGRQLPQVPLENGWIGVSADLPRVMNDCPGVVFVPFDTVEFAWNITLISAADRQLTPFEQSVQKDIAALFR